MNTSSSLRYPVPGLAVLLAACSTLADATLDTELSEAR